MEYTEISSGVLGDYIFLTIIHVLGGADGLCRSGR